MSFAQAFVERRDAPSDIQGHLQFLCDEVARRRKPNVLELGVRTGNSTIALLHGVEQSSGHLWSVDIKPAKVPEHWHESPFWTFVLGNDLDAAHLVPKEIDVLFIDTSHTYTHTLKELQLYEPRVRPGGVTLLHDTELHPEGVRKALSEYAASVGRSWEERKGSFGLGVLRKP